MLFPKSTPQIRKLYKALLLNPGDKSAMLVLAEAFEEVGLDHMAATYRWAAENEKWPFPRRGKGLRGFISGDRGPERDVYDWDVEGRDTKYPPTARLPRQFYSAICCLPRTRKYGGPHRAFILLAKAMFDPFDRLSNPAWTGRSTGVADIPIIVQNGIVEPATVG